MSPAVARLPDDSVAIVGGGAVEAELFRDDLGTTGGLVDMTPLPIALRVVTPAAVRLVTGELLVVGGEVSTAAPVCAVFKPATEIHSTTRTPSTPACGGRAPPGSTCARARTPSCCPTSPCSWWAAASAASRFTPGMPSANRVEVFEPSPR